MKRERVFMALFCGEKHTAAPLGNEPLSAHARHFPFTGTAKPRCARGNAVSVYTFPSRARSRPAYGPFARLISFPHSSLLLVNRIQLC